MICNSGSAFVARAVDGRRLKFEEEGIYHGVFVMRDRETGTLWSHYTGEAIDGPLKGETLQWLQSDRARFGRLTRERPDATVPVASAMKMRPTPPASGRTVMPELLPPGFEPTMPDAEDTRLHRHQHGLGIALGGGQRFYPLDALASVSVVNDAVGDVPVVVAIFDQGEAASAWSRCSDGRELTFEPHDWESRVAMKDAETGSVWVAGEAVAGPLAGTRLTPVRSLISDWYGWAAYFPKTSIHGADGG